MPYLVEFRSRYGQWSVSSHSPAQSIPELEAELAREGETFTYRATNIETDTLEFVSSPGWTKRFKAANGAYFDSVLDIPLSGYSVSDCYPVIDGLYMVSIPAIAMEDIMPVTPVSTDPRPAPPVQPMKDAAALVEMSIGRNKDDGRLTLQINAKALHELLDSMGAKSIGELYADRPPTTYSTISRAGEISTDLMLRRQYPVKVAISPCFERPPTRAQLKAMCESGHAAVKTILTFYQPIDIQYSIHKVIK